MLPRAAALVVASSLVGTVGAGAACSPSTGPAAAIRVAAAADLGAVMPRLVEAFTKVTGHAVVVSTGASGQLAYQIAAGAPFDLFAAANTTFVDDVIARGACDGATKAPYARGRLVVVTRRGLAPATSLLDLQDPRFTRIGIANPEHAPYGQAARVALTTVGLIDAVTPRLVFGDNVRQALQLVESGNVDAAIVSHALTVGTDRATAAVDEALHPPLLQALVVCGRGPRHDDAAAFARFILSPAGQHILATAGFAPPTTTATTTAP